MFEYQNLRRVCYNCGGEGVAVFVPVCPTCGRFVKADRSISFNGLGEIIGTNATCKRCGPVQMPFEGWYSQEDLTSGRRRGLTDEETERRARAALTWATNRILEQEKLERCTELPD